MVNSFDTIANWERLQEKWEKEASSSKASPVPNTTPNHSHQIPMHGNSSLSSSRTLATSTELDSYHSRFATTLNTHSKLVSNEPAPSSSKSSRQDARNASKLSVQSDLRPPVSAAKRLSTWSSPYAQRHHQALLKKLPSSLVEKTYQAVGEALAPSTRLSYGAGLLRFHQFCDNFTISEEDRMPASAPLLAAFVAHCKKSYEGKTITSWLSGVRYWHIINRAPWNGDDEWVNQARLLARKEGIHHRRPRRAPVSLDHLLSLLSTLDLSTPFHAALWATATTTFFGCRRLGETTVKSSSSFDPAYNVTRDATSRFRKGQIPGTSSIDILIPWTKTTKQEGATVVVTSRLDALCPVKALLNHFAVNFGCPTSLSFFAYRGEGGSWLHMLKDLFLATVDAAWANSPTLDKVSGHSFRIGGATTLLLAGVPPETVAKAGGWSSMAFLLYWRRVEEIIPLCTSRAYAGSDISRLSASIEEFRSNHGISTTAVNESIP